jgi:hypothetical protein
VPTDDVDALQALCVTCHARKSRVDEPELIAAWRRGEAVCWTCRKRVRAKDMDTAVDFKCRACARTEVEAKTSTEASTEPSTEPSTGASTGPSTGAEDRALLVAWAVHARKMWGLSSVAHTTQAAQAAQAAQTEQAEQEHPRIHSSYFDTRATASTDWAARFPLVVQARARGASGSADMRPSHATVGK